MNPHLDPAFEIEPERYELIELGPLVMDRREFLRTLGGGLLVLCLLREVPAQESGGGRRRGGGERTPRTIDAWLHIAEDGTLTACTGKVEVGQNARTSLTQAVADELHVAPETVLLVMGDTDRVPFDMGTFGSRTTPSMAPQLRRAAAAARRKLIELAAEQLAVDPDALVVKDGKVEHPPTGRSLGFGELTHGQKLVAAIEEDEPITPAERWEAAGRTVPKVNGRDFVTGRHRYASDVCASEDASWSRPPAAGLWNDPHETGSVQRRGDARRDGRSRWRLRRCRCAR